MDYKSKIEGCFGSIDLEFSIHPNDSIRARKLLGTVVENGVKWKEFRAEIKKFLKSKGCSPNHISKQMKKISKLQNWLK